MLLCTWWIRYEYLKRLRVIDRQTDKPECSSVVVDGTRYSAGMR